MESGLEVSGIDFPAKYAKRREKEEKNQKVNEGDQNLDLKYLDKQFVGSSLRKAI